jgi:hypothetical protein
MINHKRIIKKIELPILTNKNFDELKNAKLVFEHATNSVNKFYELFQKNRKGAKGGTAHVEQDLLRAMLVFSCSGLDAVIKRLIKDALVGVIDKDLGAQQEFQKFIERRMKRNGTDEKDKPMIDTNWISGILASLTPRKYMTDALQKSLTDNSLQSRDQLLSVATHFAITQSEILNNDSITRKAFDVRNEIIHEMDADLDNKKQGRKDRRVRGATDMVKYCENILTIGVNFINVVCKKMYGTS